MDRDATQVTSRVVQPEADVLEKKFTHAEVTVRTTVKLSAARAEIAWSISVHPALQGLVVSSVA